MPTPLNIGTREIPLKFAEKFSKIVNDNFINYQFEGATETTNELLKYWFSDANKDIRNYNFHIGQQQAIINTIYAHEILKIKSVTDIYTSAKGQEFIDDGLLEELSKDKYMYPKYCMKMATGTGKTWVMHALIIWQYLNAKHETTYTGNYTKNYLLVAPGLIVYERLLDAYLGKENEEQIRDFNSSDVKMYEELFIPSYLRNEVFGFIQSSVAKKDEIGRKATGEGIIAITNWHLLAGEDEVIEEENLLENVPYAVNELLPISPGKNAGNSLSTLDNNYLKGGELEYLSSLKDLMVVNDEAHHIHENKHYGEIKEVEWQKSLNVISKSLKQRFFQIDFSATPYDVTGSGNRRTKHYFPHIIVDFDLKEAIHNGLVKTIVLDKRQEIAALQLDFKALRDERNKVIGLSEGQRVMLRAGISKLKFLEEDFIKLTQDKFGVSNKYPKMFVICEDTSVSPFVVEFLKGEGLGDDDIMQIDSNRKGDVSETEWKEIKQKLFNTDKHDKPKVIVSVLMLREGFDVNNICVIVPLRTADAPILLEQTIGRGLRLMWREKEYEDIKDESRKRLLIEKVEPSSYIDILHIIEHPNFNKFYEDLLKEGFAGTTTKTGGGNTGDIIRVGLKKDFKKYDLFFPVIISDKEEVISDISFDYKSMKGISNYSLEKLENMIVRGGDVFYSQELTVQTRFGEYLVTSDLFTAQSYNEFLTKLLNTIESTMVNIGGRKKKNYPFLQVEKVKLTEVIDQYIRYGLFKTEFNPMVNENWKIMFLLKGEIIRHITKEISEMVYKAQQNTSVEDAVVHKQYFSQVDELKMREKFCLDLRKTIYEKQAYPSNKGGLEKEFMEYIDAQADTVSFIKINEVYHDFAKIYYIRTEGILAPYSPDFIVKTKKGIYIVETKGQESLSTDNVIQKKKATLDWVERVNQIKPEDRMELEWSYILLGENTFYSMKKNGAAPDEMFAYCKKTKLEEEGRLL